MENYKKYFYFRNPSTIGNDDAQTGDSVMVPVEDITGMQAASDTTVDIFFKSQNNWAGGIPGAHIHDSVQLTVKTAKRREVMEALASATNNGPRDEGIIIIADDVTSTYLTSDITAVAGVTVNTQVS